MEQNSSANAQAADANANAATDANDQSGTDNAATATAERLLAESKQWKSRASKAEKELESLKKAQLEKEGQYKELADSYKGQFDSLKKKVVKQAVLGAVSKEAGKSGCLDVEACLKLGNSELLQYDEDHDEVHGVDAFLNDLKKSKPYLFNAQKTPVINPVSPGGPAPAPKTVTPKDVVKMAKAEKNKVWADAFKSK